MTGRVARHPAQPVKTIDSTSKPAHVSESAVNRDVLHMLFFHRRELLPAFYQTYEILVRVFPVVKVEKDSPHQGSQLSLLRVRQSAYCGIMDDLHSFLDLRDQSKSFRRQADGFDPSVF